ncbi:MAG: GIY-YIG nuclease family protein [Thermodesulfobacteriota bacterium]
MSTYKRGRPKKYKPASSRESAPPSRSGEYRIRDSDGEIQYIGETSNLRKGMGQHRKAGRLGDGDSFEFLVADGRSSSKTRRAHEAKKIASHKPSGNKRGGGGGRRAR